MQYNYTLTPPQYVYDKDGNYKPCTFGDIEGDVIKTWFESDLPGLLLLTGNVGTGKTRMLYAIYAAALARNAGHVEMWGVARLIRRLQSAIGGEYKYKYDDLMEILSGRTPQSAYEREERNYGAGSKPCTMLLLDDLGVEKRTDFALAAIQEIIDAREAWKLPTAISTNLNLNTLADANHWGARVASRLKGGTIVPFSGKDKRWQK